MRLAAADALAAAGCLDCLIAAHKGYEALRSDPAVGVAAAAGAVRSGVLVAIREHELGLLDSGHLTRARQTLLASPSLPAMFASHVDLADVLVAGPSGPQRRVTLESQTLALVRLSENQLRWAQQLRAVMPSDHTSAYLWLALACGIYATAIPEHADRSTVVGDTLRVPMVAFKNAIACPLNRMTALKSLIDREPRFLEAHYFLGLAALAGQSAVGGPGVAPDLEAADAEFRAAYEWRADWPSLTLAIANLALTFEDFDRAYDFYQRSLTLVPGHADALLGKIRALTYLERHDEAVAAADEMIAIGVNPGEARYWRALNLEQLGRHDDAWEEIERADKLLVNADVPKLAGIISVNRRQIEVARQRLELALKRRPTDCQASYYLQIVDAELRDWNATSLVAAATAACFDTEEANLRREIESLQASKLPPQRRDRQVARREATIAGNARMRATAWFNAAAASYNLGRKDDARSFAERVAEDQQFGERARDLLGRLGAETRN
jgi:tetratricopeptide (TPR) repeat protein